MSHAQRISLHDVRDIGRLVGECRELGSDPLVWREHMVRELSRHCHTQIGGAAEQFPFGDWERFTGHGMVAVGYSTAREMRAHATAMTRPEYVSHDPAVPELARLTGRAFTRLRPELCDDALWYRSRHAHENCKPFHIDSYLASHFPVPHLRCIHMITLSRPWGERPLCARERRFVHLFHVELGRLWSPQSDPLSGLGPRERRVLRHLRDGDAEKEIAAKMHISRHTVHDYAKRLYRYFDAASRGELLAKLNRLRLDFRPRLAVELLQDED